LTEQIGATFGTSTKSTGMTNSDVSSLLSWTYSDYLQLFLTIKVMVNSEQVLLRTADLIELNMQQINETPGFVEVTVEKEVSRLWGLIKYKKPVTETQANEEALKLSKSYTYLSMNATMEVKPLLLTLPLFGDTVENEMTGVYWYQIRYQGTMGY